MGSSGMRTQVSREDAAARQSAQFQEVPGEAEANAVRSAFLQGSAAPVQLGAALGGMSAAMRQRAVERLQRERGNAFVQRLIVAGAVQREDEGDEEEVQELSIQALAIQREDEGGEEEVQELALQREDEAGEEEVQELSLQREGEEDELQALSVQREGEEDELQALSVQRESGAAGALVGLSQHQMVSEVQRRKGTGSALPDDTRTEMESYFGADLGGVRVHTDSSATSLSRELNAHAFTTGKDIFFGEGKFNPGSSEGKATLAHELTHVGQQGGFGAPSAAQRERDAVQALALQREDEADEEEVQELALQRQSEQEDERDV